MRGLTCLDALAYILPCLDKFLNVLRPRRATVPFHLTPEPCSVVGVVEPRDAQPCELSAQVFKLLRRERPIRREVPYIRHLFAYQENLNLAARQAPRMPHTPTIARFQAHARAAHKGETGKSLNPCGRTPDRSRPVRVVDFKSFKVGSGGAAVIAGPLASADMGRYLSGHSGRRNRSTWADGGSGTLGGAGSASGSGSRAGATVSAGVSDGCASLRWPIFETLIVRPSRPVCFVDCDNNAVVEPRHFLTVNSVTHWRRQPEATNKLYQSSARAIMRLRNTSAVA